MPASVTAAVNKFAAISADSVPVPGAGLVPDAVSVVVFAEADAKVDQASLLDINNSSSVSLEILNTNTGLRV